MARYIKANPKVAEYLKVENDRNRVQDDNYLLWQADMLAFGRLTELPTILPMIGAISLAAHEAREEQDGTVVRPLPVATDPRFVIEQETETEETPEEPTQENETESGDDSTETGENSTENPESGTLEGEAGTQPADEPTEQTEPTNEEMEA